MVGQDIEFKKGPSETHINPMRIEVSLFDQGDVTSFKDYLDRLVGNLPIEKPKGSRGRKPGKVKTGSRELILEGVKKILEIDNKEQMLKMLQEADFVAITLPFLKDMGYKIVLPKRMIIGEGKWVFMVRLIKKAKNPLNSKYDPLVLVGFKEDKAYLSSDGEVIFTHDLPKNLQSSIKTPAKAKMKFMNFLTLDERNQFRVDMEKLKTNPDTKPTRLYSRWVHDLAELNKELGIEFPLIETIPNPYA